MKIEERFINYTKIDTTSDAESKTCPSTPNQLILAEMLVEELKQLGVEDARMDENGFVYGRLKVMLTIRLMLLACLHILTPVMLPVVEI